MERKLASVAQKRSHAPTAADIDRIVAEMQSADEQTRAQALRQVCPCHLPWDSFDQLRKAAKRLQHDSSPLVRANALHVEEDAREIAALEALHERVVEYDESREEAPRRRKRRGKHRL
jgi:hypothetical protein